METDSLGGNSLNEFIFLQEMTFLEWTGVKEGKIYRKLIVLSLSYSLTKSFKMKH